MIGGPILTTPDSLLTSVFDTLRERDRVMTSLMENRIEQAELLTDRVELRRQVEFTVSATPVIDIHTHVFSPEFDGMFLHGIDELLPYHYLIAQTFPSTDLFPHRFFALPPTPPPY